MKDFLIGYVLGVVVLFLVLVVGGSLIAPITNELDLRDIYSLTGMKWIAGASLVGALVIGIIVMIPSGASGSAEKQSPVPDRKPVAAEQALGGSVIRATSGDMESFQKQVAESATLQCDGSSPEAFYEQMSGTLIAKHGPLVGVDYASHFPKFEIWFCYQDGTRVYSGERTGHHDIHFLSLGYFGEGPRYAQQFLAAAGFDLTAEEIASIKPGDGIRLENGKAAIVRERDKVVESDGVRFDREVTGTSMGLPAIYRLYEASSKAAAIAFLEKQNITAQSYFVGVRTPEGTFCKDRTGPFDAPTPTWPS